MSDDQVDELEGDWNGLALLACLQVADRMYAAGYQLEAPGYWSWRHGELEVTLEPLTFGRFALAVYGQRVLLMPAKLVVTIA